MNRFPPPFKIGTNWMFRRECLILTARKQGKSDEEIEKRLEIFDRGGNRIWDDPIVTKDGEDVSVDVAEPPFAPPANELAWPDRHSTGWQPWPKANYLMARGTTCPHCKGYSRTCRQCLKPYEPKDGDVRPCACDHNWTTDLTCQHCHGLGEGTFPGIIEVGPTIVSQKYDAVVRANLPDLQWKFVEKMPKPRRKETQPGLLLRFDGGEGLLIPLDNQERWRIVG